MEIYISIDGVLRNFLQKFEYHYNDYFLESEIEGETFEYRIKYPIQNDDILSHFIFQSKEEYSNFCFIEFALELFGHAGLSYSTAISDINKFIYNNPDINVTLIGVDELGKAKPSTLFFLSKNGFLGNNIKFIRSEQINKEWKNCDVWITDNKDILDKCPNNKIGIKFNTNYNQHFNWKTEINNIANIDELCSNSLENTITLTLTRLLKNAAQVMGWKKVKKI